MLLGRAVELAAVTAVDRQRPLAIVGEAGIGKTSLVRAAYPRERLFEGGGIASLSWKPYYALERAIRSAPPAGDAASVAAWVLGKIRSGLLFIDDLHWADAETRALLPHLAGRIRMIVAVRQGDPGAAEAERSAEAAGFESVHLDGLSTETAASIVRSRDPRLTEAEVQSIVDAAGGNPYLLEELTVGDEASGALSLSFKARLGRCSPASQRAMALLCVLGRPIDAAILGVDARELREAGLVAGSIEIAPRHDLLARAAIAELSASDIAGLHSTLARLLSDSGEIARHHFAAGEAQLAYEHALRAADRSAQPGERARNLGVAALCATGSTADELKLRAASALVDVGDLDMVQLIAAGVADTAMAAEVALCQGRALFAAGRATEAGQRIADGLRLVAGSRSKVEVRLTIERARFPFWAQDGPRALQLANDALALARGCGQEEARALGLVALAHHLCGSPDVLAHATAAVEAARIEGEPEVECEAAWVVSSLLYVAGRAREAEELTVAMVARAKSLGLRRWEMEFELCRVHDALFARGQYATAIPELRRLSREHALGPNIDQVNADLAFALADVGRTAEALTTLARGLPRAKTSYGRNIMLLAVIEAEWLAGRAAVAIAIADDVIRSFASSPPPFAWEFRLARAWASVDLGADDVDDRAPLTGSDAVASSGGPGAPATFVEASERELEGLVNLGRSDGAATAEAAFRRAADLWRGHVLRSELRCRLGEGEAALRGGNVARARRLLLDAERRAQDVGFISLLGRIHASLRRAGIARSAARTRNIDGLSGREREILMLVGEGLHTADIVRRLGLSRSTVDGLVVSARAEIDARTRVQAASSEPADEHGPPLIIIENAAELRPWMERALATTGWTIQRGWEPRRASTDGRVIHVGRIAAADDAASALLAAGRGAGILALADRDSPRLDRFAEDLGRFGNVRVVNAEREEDRGSALGDEHWRLLALLGTGSSVTHAARELHISRRTAERRLAAARLALQVRTTAAAVGVLRYEQSLLGVTASRGV
jgi:DNA-binding CsgD family transcriptional regulator